MNENSLTEQAKEEYRRHMQGSVAAFAPGRIEFLGNHLDYNGGTVLGTAINAGIYGLAQPREDDSFRLFSDSFEGAVIQWLHRKARKAERTGKLGQLLPWRPQGSPANEPGSGAWVFPDPYHRPPHLAHGRSLSSSAAVELATALCLLQLAERTLPKNELVSLCRKAENEWVGLPCGILDQGTSAFGEANQVVRIDCAGLFHTTPSPKGPHSGFSTPESNMIWLIRTMEPETGNAWMLAALQTLDPKLLHLAHCPGDLLEKAELPENQMKRARHVIGERQVHMFEEGLESNSPEELGSSPAIPWEFIRTLRKQRPRTRSLGRPAQRG